MAKIGIIVGRFQTPHLHRGHKALIDFVFGKSDQVIIFIGTSETRLTKNNPLDFEAIFHMHNAEYPNIHILISDIPDKKSDKIWSENLDARIFDMTSPDDEITLYGSRGSFIEKYHGKYKTEYFGSDVPHISATGLRKVTHACVGTTKEWREGVIWASAHKYPASYQTTDTAIVNFDHWQILLGRKKGNKKFQFIGGFVDTNDETLELSAKREVMEECKNIETDHYKYIGSYRIDDWRYRNEQDKIMTAFFCCHFIFGRAEANDDIEELRWFDIHMLSADDFEPEHHILYHAFKKYIATHGK